MGQFPSQKQRHETWPIEPEVALIQPTAGVSKSFRRVAGLGG
jgi:hypothetical protein